MSGGPKIFQVECPDTGKVIEMPLGVGVGNPTTWMETSEGRIVNEESCLTLLRPCGAAITWWTHDVMEIRDMKVSAVTVLHLDSAVSSTRNRLNDGSLSYGVQFSDGGNCTYTISSGGILRLRSQGMDANLQLEGVQLSPRIHTVTTPPWGAWPHLAGPGSAALLAMALIGDYAAWRFL